MKKHGLTAQYITLAIALRIQLVEYFDRYELISKVGSVDGNEEFEARRLTIVLLTASLCEACINSALAVTLLPEEFKKIERKPTLEKWFKHSKRVNSAFDLDPGSEVAKELVYIFECRNSTTHAQPEVYSETSTIHAGNHAPWHLLTHDRVLPIVSVPAALLIPLCDRTEPLIAGMSSSVQWELHLHEFERYRTKQS